MSYDKKKIDFWLISEGKNLPIVFDFLKIFWCFDNYDRKTPKPTMRQRGYFFIYLCMC